MAQTTTLRIQNLVNRGLKDQDRDWIIRIRCYKKPIAVNQNSTYSFFKLDQPWLKQPHWGFKTWSTVDWKIKIGIWLSEYGVSKHQLQLSKTLLIVFSNWISRGSNNHTEDFKTLVVFQNATKLCFQTPKSVAAVLQQEVVFRNALFLQCTAYSRVNKITQLYYVFIQRLLCVSNIGPRLVCCAKRRFLCFWQWQIVC